MLVRTFLCCFYYLALSEWHIMYYINVLLLDTATGFLIYIIKADMFVCLSVCFYVPYSRPNGWADRDQTRHALMSTQGVFLARSMSRSFVYACGTDRNTKHPESDTWRRLVELRPDDGGDIWRTITKLRNYSSTNKARRLRRRAASAAGASRTPSGGRVITASSL